MSSVQYPCGSKEPFINCCRPLLRGDQKATSAEQLMRFRYSAFHTGDVSYLLKTHHASQHSETEEQDLENTMTSTAFISYSQQ